MKTSLKKFLSCLMVLVLAFSITSVAFALEVETNSHTHSYSVTYLYSYLSDNNSTHTVAKTPIYTCSCSYYYTGTTTYTTASHSFGAEKWTGNHYHSGAFHYYEYGKSCSYCSHMLREWKPPIRCSGDCTTPWTIDPEEH